LLTRVLPLCRATAGRRIHGTTRKRPLQVFETTERGALVPLSKERYDPPRWAEGKVHPDHHISFGQALYSAPATTCPPGTKLEVRGDRTLVRLYKKGKGKD
jgi:hypothetical protein